MKRTAILRRTPFRSSAPRLASRAPGRKPMKRSRRKAHTVAEQEHMDRVSAMGCLACRLTGFPGTPAELHHSRLRPNGQPYGAGCRASHFEVIPLCPPHHRGGVKGVASRHLQEDAFAARYGNDLTLLAHVARLLSIAEAS